MSLVWYKAVLAASLALATLEASAVSFISLDPRASAMGGAGVAAASGASAVFINPALLMTRDSMDVTVPVVLAGRILNPKNLQNEVELYQNSGLEESFETALINFKADPATPSVRDQLVEAAKSLITQLDRFSPRSAENELGVGVAVGVSGKQMVLIADVRTISSGKVVNAGEDKNTYVSLINDGLAKNLPPTSDLFNVIVSGPDRNLQTMLISRGATISELGLAMAREADIGGHKVAVGVTPKYVNINTFDYQDPINVAVFNANDGQQQYSSFNLDLGLAKAHGDGWNSGLAIKNLIPREYETVLGGNVAIQPQLRAGVAYTGKWFTSVADLDLTKGEALGYEADTQYLGLGTEVDFSKTIKLRAGYRYNISDTQTSAVTAGVGVTLFGTALDAAMAINEDEWGFSARLGLQF